MRAQARTPHDAEISGRRSLIDTLYRKYSQGLRRFLGSQYFGSRRLSREQVADIIQETYYRLQQSKRLEEVRNPRAFLFRVARNVQINAEKHRRLSIEDSVLDDGYLEVATEEPGPCRRINAEQELALVRAAIADLPARCRDAFIMNRFEHMTFTQIAAELGLSVSMIEKHVSFAISFLRARVDEARPAASLEGHKASK